MYGLRAGLFLGLCCFMFALDAQAAEPQSEEKDKSAMDDSGASYVPPSSPSLYKKQSGYLKQENYFIFGGQVMIGRVSPAEPKRDAGPSQLVAGKFGYVVGMPTMQDIVLGGEIFSGKLHFSTGQMNVDYALGLNLGFTSDIHNQLKWGVNLYAGKTHARFQETVDGLGDIQSRRLVPGNYYKGEGGVYLSPLNNIEVSAGAGFGYFEYSLRDLISAKDVPFPEMKAPGENAKNTENTEGTETTAENADEGGGNKTVSATPAKTKVASYNNQVRLRVPYVFVGVALQL